MALFCKVHSFKHIAVKQNTPNISLFILKIKMYKGCNNADSHCNHFVPLQVSSGQGAATTCHMVWLFPKHLWMNRNGPRGCQQDAHSWTFTTTRPVERLAASTVVILLPVAIGTVLQFTCLSFLGHPSQHAGGVQVSWRLWVLRVENLLEGHASVQTCRRCA